MNSSSSSLGPIVAVACALLGFPLIQQPLYPLSPSRLTSRTFGERMTVYYLLLEEVVVVPRLVF